LHGNDKIEELDSRLHGNDKKLQGNDKMDAGFLFAWK